MKLGEPVAGDRACGAGAPRRGDLLRRFRFRTAAGALAATAVAAIAAGCGTSVTADAGPAGLAGPATFGTPQAGGSFRAETADLGLTDALDPTGEYSATAWGLYSLILRPLLGTRRTAGPQGNALVPDLAEDLPEVSPDGRVYTLRLREGVRFGPPVSREITSADVAFALRRIADPEAGAQYAGLYSVIEGFDDVLAGRAETIRGIRTPDARTIVFRLVRPTGDFGYRLALPAAGPMPREVATCHRPAGEYGRYLIASGPYMLAGSERLDLSSCGRQRPISGFAPLRGISLVRNPQYDAATDETGRRNLPDRFSVRVNTRAADIYARVERGLLEEALAQPPPDVLRSRLAGPPELRERLRANAADRMLYLSMNLTTPPFDDVHVRRALNLAMDLDGIRRVWGGPAVGEIPTDVLPDTLLADRLTSDRYTPLQEAPFDGDVDAARAEMALSRYDTDHDGVCDAAACRGIHGVTLDVSPWREMTPVIRASAARVGVYLSLQALPAASAYALSGNPRRAIPFSAEYGWGKDVPDPSSFMALFSGSAILPAGGPNASLTGLAPERARELGVAYPAGGVPSVDEDIAGCAALTGSPRADCYEALDRRLTEEVVPWIPYLDARNIDVLGPAVTAYDYDQFAGTIAWSRVALDPSLQEGPD